MKRTTKGVIYIATGGKYVKEALRSAVSLKKHMPTLPITIFSDKKIKSKIFDNIIKIMNPKYTLEEKVWYINKSPYDYTLFLDTDTYICNDISELFELLDRFDIAVAQARSAIAYLKQDIPDSFPELNTGVILFKKSSKVKALFSNWLDLYLKDKKKGIENLYPKELLKNNKAFQRRRAMKGIHNQPTFREALYKSNLRITTLTPEYNCKGQIGFVNWKVKIIHSRKKEIESINRIINSTSSPRVYLWNKENLQIFDCHENLPTVRVISEKNTKNKTSSVINNIDRWIEIFGIFLKKRFPKVYYQLKKVK